MAVSKRLRYEILRRDDHACRYCGAKAPDMTLTVDHVIPVALGGDDKPGNLVAACADCNAGKSASSPDAPIVEGIEDDALRWARAMVRAHELARAKRSVVEEFTDRFDYYWRAFLEDAADQFGWWRASDWRSSIARFRDAGLDGADLEALVDETMSRDHIPNGKLWRYFCGCCWNAIRARQDTARRLIDAGEIE